MSRFTDNLEGVVWGENDTVQRVLAQHGIPLPLAPEDYQDLNRYAPVTIQQHCTGPWATRDALFVLGWLGY